MNTVLHKLVDALRDELQQYGELLARLDPSSDLHPEPARVGLLPHAREFAAQGAVIQEARSRRWLFQQQFGWSLGQPEDCSFATLIPLSPATCRPLLRALVDEISTLAATVRERALARHQLLSRSAAWMQDCAGLFALLDASAALNADSSVTGIKDALAAGAVDSDRYMAAI